MRYCVDRTPTMVFESKAVMYRLSDLSVAHSQFRIWRRGEPGFVLSAIKQSTVTAAPLLFLPLPAGSLTTLAIVARMTAAAPSCLR